MPSFSVKGGMGVVGDVEIVEQAIEEGVTEGVGLYGRGLRVGRDVLRLGPDGRSCVVVGAGRGPVRGVASANSRKAAKARGPYTVAGPPFIRMATPIASATSSAVAPLRAAPSAWAAMQPSHSLVTAIASAMSSLVLVLNAPGPSTAPCSCA